MDRRFRIKNVNSDMVHLIEKPTVVIGRTPQCDIFVDSTLLSRQHASITLTDNNIVTIEDLGSTNGTFVNTMRVTAPTKLKHSDLLTIGDVKFILIDSYFESRNDAYEDILENPKGFSLDGDSTSYRTMVQSSIFKSLGLDPLTLEDTSADDDDSLFDMSFRSVDNGSLDFDRVPAVFIIQSGQKRGAVIKLSLPAFSEQEWSVGRGQLCDVVLDDPTVSSNHATVCNTEDGWVIEDCGSTNGIKLNGEKIQQSYFVNNDVISIGSIKLLFKTGF